MKDTLSKTPEPRSSLEQNPPKERVTHKLNLGVRDLEKNPTSVKVALVEEDTTFEAAISLNDALLWKETINSEIDFIMANRT